MAERPIPSKATKPPYAAESVAGTESETPSANPGMPMLVQATAREKKGLGRKFKQAFTGDDVQSVGNYLFFDVIVPGAKNIIFDLLSEGARRILFGGGAPGSTNRYSGSASGRGPAYSRMYSGNQSVQANVQQREISQHARSTHDFKEITFPDRGSAEEVRDGLIAYIDEYSSVTVADFYQASGISSSHVDSKHGWKDLSSSNIRNTRGGYIIELPPTVVID